TLGGAGHSLEIVKRGGIVLGLDVDQDALDFVQEKLKTQISNLKLVVAKGNFKNIDTLAQENGFLDVAGILFDLGVSSHHFDVASRGFSIQQDGPLDMRMDQDLGVKAADLLAILTKGELYELFTKFGEERFAYAISNSIVRARQVKRIEMTSELVELIGKVVRRREEALHCATRVFQALRIAVNDELTSIDEALPKALELLQAKGRIAVISFHSLEDRIVKHTFKKFEEEGLGTIVTKKPIVPTDTEIERNSRSRSAKLRIFEKL
ncbi:MAG TPA: 16S rRNA (cytosine(1402)-N(4))-methyltransferase RsmH, partial [Patescibacteria group bacterium]|nr:16S rRNA (cytosine(1402)-N(4))-methyltransferase RsmH [Patescibacteria group bacterium]